MIGNQVFEAGLRCLLDSLFGGRRKGRHDDGRSLPRRCPLGMASWCVSCGFVVMSWHLCLAGELEDHQRVIVEMRRVVTVDHSLVVLSDVADVRGGDVGLRRQISRMDVTELNPAPSQEQLPQSRVRLRLLLAGISESRFIFSGATMTVITNEHCMINDERIIEAVRAPAATLWHLSPDSLSIRLTQPLAKALPGDFQMSESHRLTPFLRPEMLPGRQRLSFGVYDGSKLVSTFSLMVDTQVRLPVAIAVHDMQIGDKVAMQDVRFEPQQLVGKKAVRVASHDVLGQYVVRDIRSGQAIEKDQLADTLPESGNDSKTGDVVVRARTLVSLVAQRGNMKVVFRNAELISSARVGESVRVRNLESKRVLVGRLISPTEVAVPF